MSGRVLSRLAPAAETLHAKEPRADGIVWASRHAPERAALMLFGDRIAELIVVAGPVALDSGRGLELAEAAAMRADVGLLL